MIRMYAVCMSEIAKLSDVSLSAETVIDAIEQGKIEGENLSEVCGKPYPRPSIAGSGLGICQRQPGHEFVCGPWGSWI